MPKFYFTYGSDERFPFQYGWTEIEALSYELACAAFRAFHPDRDPEVRCLNCADVYTEEQFKDTLEWVGVNYRDRCHERITLTRELLDKKGESFI